MDDGRISTTTGENSVTSVASRHGRVIGGGRLGVYAALGALTWTVPIPLLPDTLARRVRGALLFDVAARHGLSLTKEARAILAEPGGGDGPRSVANSAVQYFGLRLIRRLPRMSVAGRVLGPARSGVSTWALGYLFDRYIERARSERAVRIDADEARKIRLAVDRALVHALTAEARKDEHGAPPEDLRDATTQVIDGVLSAVASAPGWLVRRLDAAFDELMPGEHGGA